MTAKPEAHNTVSEIPHSDISMLRLARMSTHKCLSGCEPDPCTIHARDEYISATDFRRKCLCDIYAFCLVVKLGMCCSSHVASAKWTLLI